MAKSALVRSPFMIVAAAVITTLVGASGVAAAKPPAASGAWGVAREILGTTSLNQGGLVESTALSCGSPGNCVVGGSEQTRSHHLAPFVASEVRGIWGRARVLPGITPLDAGKTAQLSDVSCGAPGNCLVGGSYFDATGRLRAFVASEVKGAWHAARNVPGLATLNGGQSTVLDAVSCRGAGNCLVGGSYRAGKSTQAFVATQTHGIWSAATALPGVRALNIKGDAAVTAVSCASLGNCAAVGTYADVFDNAQPFVASEVGGTWSAAIEVPGLAALHEIGPASVNAVSCGSPGNCGAGGGYSHNAENAHAFVVSEVNGTWRAAQMVRGFRTSSAFTPFAVVTVMSCTATGGCAAGGTYRNGPSPGQHLQAFVVSRAHGTWGSARELPGTVILNKGADAQVRALACASAGNCAAGGLYTDAGYRFEAFVASEVNGSWHKAIEVPGTAALNKGQFAQVSSVSCPLAGACAASGFYEGSRYGPFDTRGFVVRQR